jgi:uncharacterized membrane protein YcaP (DUF421 family)
MPEYVIVAGRSILSFLLLFTLARVLGKKQISQLTFFDYVVGIVIGDMAASIAIETDMKFMNGFIGLVVYTLLSLILAYGAIKSFKFRDLVESSPAILVKNGRIMEKNLFKSKMTFDDLLNGLREKDAFKLSEVELAMLETNGQISVLKKPEYQSLTPKDIGLNKEEESVPSLIIIDGTLLENRLKYLGYTKQWVLDEIKNQGANKFEDVFLAQIDSSGNLFIDLFNDEKEVNQGKKKPQLSAKLRRIQADIEDIASQTTDPNAKQMYFNQSKELQKLINKLNPDLTE